MLPDSVENDFRADHPWRTLANLYWPERRWVVLAVVSYLFKASPLWVLPVITANIIDILAHRGPGGVHALLINAAVGMVSIAQNIPSAVVYVDSLSRAVRNVEIRLRSALVRRFQMLSIGYHNRTDSGTLQTKVLRDIESIEQLSRQIVDTGELAVVSILVSLAVTAWRMPAFVPAFLLFVPLVWLTRKFMAGRLQRYNQALRKELEGMNSLVLGMITMIPITRAHAVEEAEMVRVENQFGQVRTAARSFDLVAGFFGSAAWVVLMLFNLGGLTLGAWLSYTGVLPLTPGDLVLLAGYFNTIMASVLQVNAMLPILTRGFDALRSIGEVMECPDIEENRGKRPVQRVKGEFRFENVAFSYQANTTPALREIDLHIAAGEAVGIVGPSGSGKSTLASLVTGFHRPTQGRVLLDGIDMNAIDLRTYRRHLAIVSQQTILFNGTLRENIVYGAAEVSEQELEAAVEAANATSFIRDLPSGLATELGAGGVQLSGGQRQRIAIARALLRNPRVLILDEATSSLDSTGESVVEEALERLMKGRTTLVIAHRAGALRHVNRLAHLQAGRIAKLETMEPNALVAG
jgi:ATP-binding cassette subfamily B protein